MRLKQILRVLITAAAEAARASGDLNFDALPAFEVETPKQEGHGDLAANLALVLAREAKMPPRKVAEILVSRVRLAAPTGMLQKIEIAGPGFINFFIEDAFWYRVLPEIHERGPAYGDSDLGAGRRIQVEFVSANPTGPLHIGHGRGAALGDALANLLGATGHQVVREYYINDVGNQILTLGKSLYFRLRERLGEVIEFPEDGYQGDYMKELAGNYLAQGKAVPPAPPHEDDLIELGRYAGAVILAEIKRDLEDFGVRFDHWFSETELYRRGLVEQSFEPLREQGWLEERDGALWFKASEFGDEKDRPHILVPVSPVQGETIGDQLWPLGEDQPNQMRRVPDDAPRSFTPRVRFDVEEVRQGTGEHTLGVIRTECFHLPFCRVFPSLGQVDFTPWLPQAAVTLPIRLLADLTIDVTMGAFRSALVTPYPKVLRVVCPAYACIFCHDGLLLCLLILSQRLPPTCQRSHRLHWNTFPE